MNCNQKSNIKLISNVIQKSSCNGKHHINNFLIGVQAYLPFDLLPSIYSDVDLKYRITPKQRLEYTKRLFWTKETRESKKRFYDEDDNHETCKDCKYRDICY